MNNLNYGNYIVHITTQQKKIDILHPLNSFGSEKATGTGFFIDHGIILTCYHVIQNGLEIVVTIKKDSTTVKIKAHVKYIFPDDDLAVIELEDKNIECGICEFYIITSSEINKDVNTVGFPLDSYSLKINKGVISGFQDSNIQTDSTLNSGNSGGPLILNNKVIGVNQSKLVGDASNTGYAIPIFRFLILYKLKPKQLKLINKKPNFLFKYQNNEQEFYGFKYGVRVSQLHDKSVLKRNNINVDDLILKVNNNKVDHSGKIKFPFFPDKINLNELYLWFTEGDSITFTIYSASDKKTKDINIIAEYTETNLINYYLETNRQYTFENNGLVFSVFTDYHMENIGDLEMKLSNKVKLLSRYININSKFTIYLADLMYSKLKFTEYPINEIVTHINNVEITSYDILVDIMKSPVKNFRTINNHVYFV
jgi:S1-C subfamily serine protease